MSQDNTGKQQAWLLRPNQLKARTQSLGNDFDAWLGREKESRKDGKKNADFGQTRKNKNASGDEEMDVKMPPAQFSRLGLGCVDDRLSDFTRSEEEILNMMQISSLLGQNPGDNFGDLTADSSSPIEKSRFDFFLRGNLGGQNLLQQSVLLQQQQQLNKRQQLSTNLALLDCLRQRGRFVEEAFGSALLPRFENAILHRKNSFEPLLHPAQQLSAPSRLSLAHLALLEQLSLSSQEHQQFATGAGASLNRPRTQMDFAELFARDRCNSPPTQLQHMISFPAVGTLGGRALISAVTDGSSITPANTNENVFAANQVDAQEMTIRTAAPQARKKRKNKKDKYKPKRPLSAYNFFFQEERSKLLNEIANSTAHTTEESRAIGAPSLAPAVGQTAAKRKRRRDREEPHGMIAFESLAKIIGSRWKNVTGDKLAAYQQQAETDLQRYKQEMEAYHQKQQKRARVKDLDERSNKAESNAESNKEKHASVNNNSENN